MAQGDGNPGMNKLAQAMNERIRAFHEAILQDLTIDFGKIGNDWSLQANSFPKPIPKGDYMVCRSLSGSTIETTSGGTDQHSHKVTIPKLAKGDRVLLAWIQNEVCVIDVIMSSSKL